MDILLSQVITRRLLCYESCFYNPTKVDLMFCRNHLVLNGFCNLINNYNKYPRPENRLEQKKKRQEAALKISEFDE